MASKDADKDKEKAKPKAAAKGESKEKDKDKEKAKAQGKDKEKAKGKEKEASEATIAKEEKPKAPPRPPVDHRLKVLKKFHGRFLPRGPLRDRHKALMDRWNSGDDHGGVTLEELKSLYNDWKAARQKQAENKAVV
jgi:hypothetical protein